MQYLVFLLFLAFISGEEINEFSCSFGHDFCNFTAPNGGLEWKLVNYLSSIEREQLNLPDDLEDCLLISPSVTGNVKGSLKTEKVVLGQPIEAVQFELYLKNQAEVSVHLYNPKSTGLIFKSSLDLNIVKEIWYPERIEINRVNIIQDISESFQISIEPKIISKGQPSWLALRKFVVFTKTETTTEVKTTEVTTTEDNETTIANIDCNATVTAITVYPSSSPLELNRFENILTNLGWKNITVILTCVFFGIILFTSVYRISKASKLRNVVNDDEVTLFDSIETISSYHVSK